MKQQLNIDVKELIAQQEARFSRIKDEAIRNRLMAHLNAMKAVPPEMWKGEMFGKDMGYVDCSPAGTVQWGSKPCINYYLSFSIGKDGKLKGDSFSVSNQYTSEVAQKLTGLQDEITSTPKQLEEKMKADEKFNETHGLLERAVKYIKDEKVSNEQVKEVIDKVEQIIGVKAAGLTLKQRKSSTFENIAKYLHEVDKNTRNIEHLQVIQNGQDDSDMIVREIHNKIYDVENAVFEDAEILKQIGVDQDKLVFQSTVAEDSEVAQTHIDLVSGRVTSVKHTVSSEQGPFHAGQENTTEIQYEGTEGPNQIISIKKNGKVSLDLAGSDYSRSTGESQSKASVPSNVELSVDLIKKLEEKAIAKTESVNESGSMTM